MKKYLILTKPGIIFGNAVTAAGGFFLASKGSPSIWIFLMMLCGLSLVVASACVFNNYSDRHVDELMTRTKNRPLVKGDISIQDALLFGTILGVGGLAILFYTTTLLATFMALAGFLAYVVLYGICKYRSTLGTPIGSISGAIPPVVGYTAVVGRLDFAALLLFATVVLWQMPHFYAIALYRLQDYKSASIPVLPVVKGAFQTKLQMLFYVAGFWISCLLFPFYGYTGPAFFAVAATSSAAWFYIAMQGFTTSDDILWARKMFLCSLIIIMAICLSFGLDTCS